MTGVHAPPLKIQGIKTKVVPHIRDNADWDGSGRWIEPFVGSAVVALNIAPRRALLGDTNPHLIRFYSAIQAGTVTAATVRGRSLSVKADACCVRGRITTTACGSGSTKGTIRTISCLSTGRASMA